MTHPFPQRREVRLGPRRPPGLAQQVGEDAVGGVVDPRDLGAVGPRDEGERRPVVEQGVEQSRRATHVEPEQAGRPLPHRLVLPTLVGEQLHPDGRTLVDERGERVDVEPGRDGADPAGQVAEHPPRLAGPGQLVGAVGQLLADIGRQPGPDRGEITTVVPPKTTAGS